MALASSAHCWAALSLLLASAAASASVHQTGQSNLRRQAAVGQQPISAVVASSMAENQLGAREPGALANDEVPEGTRPDAPAVAPVAMQAQVQQEQLPQMQQQQLLFPPQQQAQPQHVAPAVVTPPSVQEQQLLQAQAAQMQQLQQQLRQQQQELQRLQAMERQPQPPHQSKQPQAQEATQVSQPPRPRTPPQVSRKSLVGVGTQLMTKSEMQSGTSGVAKPKGWDQCLKFARFVKTQDVTGLELVRVWKSTCEPAVQSGRATERYKLMCNSLSGVVQPYAAQIDYDVEQLCDSVLAVFHDVTATDARAR